MEITKELIEQNKQPFNRDFFCQVFESRDRRVIEPVLDGLGRLPDEFDGSLLVPLLGHFDANIRLLAAKNIGKLKCDSFLHKVVESLQDESNTLVRRELVSAVGRMRSEQAIPALLEVLDDPDPKVVLQAIRALLPFKQQESVEIALTELADHPNELIRSAIAQELDTHRSASKETATQHVQSPDCLKNVFVQGDVRDILANVPDQSVHLTFTSPPYYNARDYSIYQSYEGYLTFLTDVFREVHRITKEGRFFVLNTSLVIVPRMSRKHSSSRYLIPFDIHPRLIELGFEFIDDIIWQKPDPSAKNRNGGFFQHRKPLGYKANSVIEYVIVYRKKSTRLLDWNIRAYSDETVEQSKVQEDYEKTNVWKIAPSSDPTHPAIFPVELARRVIQFYSYRGDLVFDPFGGIGTVAAASLSQDRFFFSAEQEPKYVERASQLLGEGSLFNAFRPRFLDLATLATEMGGRISQ